MPTDASPRSSNRRTEPVHRPTREAAADTAGCARPTGTRRARVRRWAGALGLSSGLALGLALGLEQAAAAESAPDRGTDFTAPPPEHPYKLTLGRYDYADTHGVDANLRWHHALGGNVWLGHYQDPDFGSQWRSGVDAAFDAGAGVQVQPSFQVASGGFVGASVTAQWGQPFFGLIGWGRTNLRPYFNLNFDPNDAITAGLGWQGAGGTVISMTLIADDRLHTGQKDWHLQGRWPLTGGQRLLIDLMHKSGLGDSGPVNANGWTVGYDAPRWFARLAHDPKQNFSAQDATRVSLGMRF